MLSLKLSAAALAILSFAPTAFADMHTSLYCVNVTPAYKIRHHWYPRKVQPQNDATKLACPAYAADGCADCVVGERDGKVVCNSAGDNLDGDAMTKWCKKNGADMGYE